MSEIGISSWWPKSCHATSWWGSWSTEVALNLLRVRSVLIIRTPWVWAPSEWAFGLPR